MNGRTAQGMVRIRGERARCCIRGTKNGFLIALRFLMHFLYALGRGALRIRRSFTTPRTPDAARAVPAPHMQSGASKAERKLCVPDFSRREVLCASAIVLAVGACTPIGSQRGPQLGGWGGYGRARRPGAVDDRFGSARTNSARDRHSGAARPAWASGVQDNNPRLWVSNHPSVQRFREQYTRTRTVQRALERGQRYLPYIRQEFRRHHLPEELGYLPLIESLYHVDANSGSALGMWQFTRQTAVHMGMQVRGWRDERLDWRKSTQAASRYLAALGKRFRYDWALALAAYNGGPNYLDKAMKQQGTRNYFRLYLRQETAQYVPRFLGMLQVAKAKHSHLLAGR